MLDKLREFVRSESGATAIEYALIASLIAVVIISAVASVGAQLRTRYTNIANALS